MLVLLADAVRNVKPWTMRTDVLLLTKRSRNLALIAACALKHWP